MTNQPEALTICLSRALAAADGLNQQKAMIDTATRLRGSTRDTETYNALGDFLSATNAERQAIVTLMMGVVL